MPNIISVYGGDMIKKQQRVILTALIKNTLVFEARFAELNYMWKSNESDDLGVRELLTSNLELAGKNCDEAGKALLDFLDEITEKTDETD